MLKTEDVDFYKKRDRFEHKEGYIDLLRFFHYDDYIDIYHFTKKDDEEKLEIKFKSGETYKFTPM